MPWWFDPSNSLEWSKDEHQAWTRIWLAVGGVFQLLFGPETWLLNKLGFGMYDNVRIGIVVCPIAAVCLAPRICRWLWPAVMEKADEDAAKRLARRK